MDGQCHCLFSRHACWRRAQFKAQQESLGENLSKTQEDLASRKQQELPIVEDNARLVRENNALHRQLIQGADRTKETQRQAPPPALTPGTASGVRRVGRRGDGG